MLVYWKEILHYQKVAWNDCLHRKRVTLQACYRTTHRFPYLKVSETMWKKVHFVKSSGNKLYCVWIDYKLELAQVAFNFSDKDPSPQVAFCLFLICSPHIYNFRARSKLLPGTLARIFSNDGTHLMLHGPLQLRQSVCPVGCYVWQVTNRHRITASNGCCTGNLDGTHLKFLSKVTIPSICGESPEKKTARGATVMTWWWGWRDSLHAAYAFQLTNICLHSKHSSHYVEDKHPAAISTLWK